VVVEGKRFLKPSDQGHCFDHHVVVGAQRGAIGAQALSCTGRRIILGARSVDQGVQTRRVDEDAHHSP
jgi:hypothetical protein